MEKFESFHVCAVTGFSGGRLLKPFSALALACFLSSPAIAENAYTLTPVDKTGENTITKYTWDKDKNELVPANYKIDYKTSYGEGGSVKSYTLPDGKTNVDYHYNPDTLLDRDVEVNDDGDVVGNFVNTNSNEYALSNYRSIKNLKGDFVASKGLVNTGLIESIVSDFIANGGTHYGASGVLYNHIGWPDYKMATINLIKGDFIGNKITPYIDHNGSVSVGIGAIENTGHISTITANFINNTVTSPSGSHGGAIYNGMDKTYGYYGRIDNISGDFVNNSATSTVSDMYTIATAEGGAIFNAGNIDNISGNFIKNNVTAINNGGSRANANGGALYNSVSIKTISGSFIENSAVANGGNGWTGGGAIHNRGLIESIIADFIGNSSTGYGGGIFVTNGTINYLKGDFIKNSADHDGGAIYLNGTAKNIENSSFIENNSVGTKAKGGAIYSFNDLLVTANAGISTFKGNFIINENGEKDYQAIYIAGNNGNTNLNLSSINNGVIFMHDNINGDKGYTVNITGDGTGRFALYNDIYNANVTLGNTTLDTINNNVHVNHFDTFKLTDNANMTVDVDLAAETMDRITADSYGPHNGILTVSGMNLTSDLAEGKDSTSILFAEQGLKDNVAENSLELPTSHQTTAYTPIYKYDVHYDNRDDAGYFVFNRGGLNSSNPSDNFNPAVLSTPVASQAGGQSIINETVRFAFQHADMFSQMPYVERMAYINQNKYAITEGNPAYAYDFEKLEKGAWVKPFTSFEKINLHNGPDVNAITYGTLVGFDSDINELGKGWYNVHSAYVGYNGSSLNYQGVDTTLNGGLAGLTETFYKGNFFTAITGTAGASVGTNSTMYGNEDYTMLLGGIGTKTGYNFEFKDGKCILQPILFMNYSFVNTFDYTNAAGVKVDADPFHTFQINPSVKAIANLKNGWQPYASVGFVWNVLNSGKVKANNVVLPTMSIDPYVEYGVGVQKSWKDRFTGYGQAMVRNGGRNGVALTFGFRWALGKDSEDL